MKPTAWPCEDFCTTLHMVHTSRVSINEENWDTEQPLEGWMLLCLKLRWSLGMRSSNHSHWLKSWWLPNLLDHPSRMFFSSALSPFLQAERVQQHAAGRSKAAQAGLHSLQTTQGQEVLAATLKNLIAALAYSTRLVKYNVLQVLDAVFPAVILPPAFNQDLWKTQQIHNWRD